MYSSYLFSTNADLEKLMCQKIYNKYSSQIVLYKEKKLNSTLKSIYTKHCLSLTGSFVVPEERSCLADKFRFHGNALWSVRIQLRWTLTRGLGQAVSQESFPDVLNKSKMGLFFSFLNWNNCLDRRLFKLSSTLFENKSQWELRCQR